MCRADRRRVHSQEATTVSSPMSACPWSTTSITFAAEPKAEMPDEPGTLSLSSYPQAGSTSATSEKGGGATDFARL
jgi:hypothetical protein